MNRSLTAALWGALFLLSGLGMASARVVPEDGAVSFTLDDSLLAEYQYGLPIMTQYGIHGTFFITTRDVGLNPTGSWATMNWAQIFRLKQLGHEIGAHTVDHRDLTTLVAHEVQWDIGYSAAQIARIIGKYPVSFATPYGNFNPAVLAQVRVLYESHTGAWDNANPNLPTGLNDFGSVNQYNISRLTVERDTPTAAAVCTLLNRAVRDSQWLVLGFHQIVPTPVAGPDGQYMVSTAKFAAIARCAWAAHENYNFRRLSVHDALEYSQIVPVPIVAVATTMASGVANPYDDKRLEKK